MAFETYGRSSYMIGVSCHTVQKAMALDATGGNLSSTSSVIKPWDCHLEEGESFRREAHEDYLTLHGRGWLKKKGLWYWGGGGLVSDAWSGADT